MTKTGAGLLCATVGLCMGLAAVYAAALAERNGATDKQAAGASAERSADGVGSQNPAESKKEKAEEPLKLPRWWGDNPLPFVKSNCMRCHLTAGRELTYPVQDFARSVHDYQEMSCSDCHGGNLEDDALAHEEEFGFIGTKLSAHMAGCAECHAEQASAFKQGAHYWDLSKSINIEYPVCIDCHGHHDIAKPPKGFALRLVCTDCHENFAEQMPGLASVVAENDRLWQVLREVRRVRRDAETAIPDEFYDAVASARAATAALIHPAEKITENQAAALNKKVERLRKDLETWLQIRKN